MIIPSVTGFYAALLALLYIGLTIWVVAGRARYRVHHGDGGTAELNRRIRAHGNFAEYVPFILLLAALLEGQGGSPILLHGMLASLLLARLIHPVGMTAPEASMRQYGLRGVGAMITWLVLITAAVALLVRSV
jgi:uncharacterized membrane protein YecN with MAPEG domain